jgi:hypothetical protein
MSGDHPTLGKADLTGGRVDQLALRVYKLEGQLKEMSEHVIRLLGQLEKATAILERMSEKR